MGASPIIDEIYRTGVVCDASGNEYALSSAVDSAEGDYLYRLILSDDTVTKTLEVGCAFGLSSLHICEALRERRSPSHTIIDPEQMGRSWNGVGVAQLERSGIDFYSLILEPSELAMPKLLRTQSESFDLVFIDGWHTFDHTMLDMFYANRLTRLGGYVVIDDCNWASVAAVVSYFSNYPAYERVMQPRLVAQHWRQRMAQAGSKLLPPRVARTILPASLHDRVYRRMRFPSIVALRKTSEDARSWAWFEGF